MFSSLAKKPITFKAETRPLYPWELGLTAKIVDDDLRKDDEEELVVLEEVPEPLFELFAPELTDDPVHEVYRVSDDGSSKEERLEERASWARLEKVGVVLWSIFFLLLCEWETCGLKKGLTQLPFFGSTCILFQYFVMSGSMIVSSWVIHTKWLECSKLVLVYDMCKMSHSTFLHAYYTHVPVVTTGWAHSIKPEVAIELRTQFRLSSPYISGKSGITRIYHSPHHNTYM